MNDNREIERTASPTLGLKVGNPVVCVPSDVRGRTHALCHLKTLKNYSRYSGIPACLRASAIRFRLAGFR